MENIIDEIIDEVIVYTEKVKAKEKVIIQVIIM